MVLYKTDMLVGVSMEFYSVQDLKKFLIKQKFLGRDLRALVLLILKEILFIKFLMPF